MTYLGHIENGAIVLDESAILPDGAKVRVELVLPDGGAIGDESPPRTIVDRLKNVIGKGTGMPSDFAENHDHYIHGAPKE